jgi:hypothetical protein
MPLGEAGEVLLGELAEQVPPLAVPLLQRERGGVSRAAYRRRRRRPIHVALLFIYLYLFMYYYLDHGDVALEALLAPVLEQREEHHLAQSADMQRRGLER